MRRFRSGCDCNIEGRVLGRLVGLFKDQLNIGDPDHRSMRQNSRRNHASTVNKCSVATAQVHDLKLIGIMAPDDRMLPRDMRVCVQTDRILTAPSDRGGVADFHLEWLALRGAHF